jgi:hypothetical protein
MRCAKQSQREHRQPRMQQRPHEGAMRGATREAMRSCPKIDRALSQGARQALEHSHKIPIDVPDRIAKAVLRAGLSYPLWVNQLVQQAFEGVQLWQLSDVECLLWQAERLGLDPLQRELMAVQRSCDIGDRIGFLITLNGWLTLLHRSPGFQGLQFTEGPAAEGGLPMWISCAIYKKDFCIPIEVREYACECANDHPSWQQFPRRMLRHKALIQAARLALGVKVLGEEASALAEGAWRDEPEDRAGAPAAAPNMGKTPERRQEGPPSKGPATLAVLKQTLQVAEKCD